MSENHFSYEGTDVDITWDRRLCIHVQECTRAKEGLFEKNRKPWAEPDRAPADDVVQVIARCPTGCLTTTRKDGGEPEQAAIHNTVVVANNGPLYVRGELDIKDIPDDMPGTALRAALCRCGHSANKPFCDNAHEAAGFADHGAIGDCGPGLAATGGPLTITPMPNGPLRVEGNLTLVSGAGVPTWNGAKAALCRCGESANKPFCDGTHKQIGFTTQ